MTLGQLLKEYRVEHNMSIRDMAKVLETSPAYVGTLEKGVRFDGKKAVPKRAVLDRIANVLGVTYIELVILLETGDFEPEKVLGEGEKATCMNCRYRTERGGFGSVCSKAKLMCVQMKFCGMWEIENELHD